MTCRHQVNRGAEKGKLQKQVKTAEQDTCKKSKWVGWEEMLQALQSHGLRGQTASGF